MHEFEFNGQRDKRLTLGLLATMFMTSMLDMILDWVNLDRMESSDFKHGLVIGPPTNTALVALQVFNIIGTLLFLVEVVNASWLVSRSRRALIPLVFEQGLVLLAEEIPMAVINLAIVNCRLHYVTGSQIAAGLFGVINVGVRLYAYGWYREVEHGKKDPSMLKVTIRLAVYIAVSMLWLILFITAIFSWQAPTGTVDLAAYSRFDTFNTIIKEADVDPYTKTFVNLFLFDLPPQMSFHQRDLSKTEPPPAWLKEPSIVLLNTWKWERAEDFRMDLFIDRQGMNPYHPWLLPSLDFARYGNASATYPCRRLARGKPPTCDGMTSLKFQFRYAKPMRERPFGGIYYNFAGMTSEGTCVQFNTSLHDDWTLAYLKVNAIRSWSGRNVTVIATAPWDRTCSVPTPGYDPDIDVCI